MRYLPNSFHTRQEMLEAAGFRAPEELFAQIPDSLKLHSNLKLPGPMSEPELVEFFQRTAARSSREFVSLLGAGAYSHYRPAAIDALLSRGEFFTAYTPYQAEIAQGTLQAMFEFQTLITQLTGMEVANASLYDGSTATAEAALMASRITRRNRLVVARTLHPEYRQVLATYVRTLGTAVEEISWSASGELNLAVLDSTVNSETAAVIVQSPNFFGIIERVQPIAEVTHRVGALLIVVITEPLSLAILKPPAEADIVCGEAQSFGVPVAFGGPYLGYLATREKFTRQMPGRLVGQTQDREGRRGFVLTLATREQHIRREKATSNICTNQSLCALAATVYLCLLGKQGLRALAEQNFSKAHDAARKLVSEGAASLPMTGAFFNEFVARAPGAAETLLAELQDQKILGGLHLYRFYPEWKDHLLICVTEKVSRSIVDQTVQGFARLAESTPGTPAMLQGRHSRGERG
jgi:glycine dehydrogenase subunit 1